MIGFLLTAVVALLLLTAVLAPLESLGWWAGWFGEHEAPALAGAPVPVEPPKSGAVVSAPATHYLVYLSGIGAIDGNSIPAVERVWLDTLNNAIPGSELVADVFPYSVTSAGLTSRRFAQRFYRWLEQRRLKNPQAIEQAIVNLRNMFQVAVSADKRYGPIYNVGVARSIVRRLSMHGYVPASGVPITILGWSGGGQIALGAAPYLRSMLQAPIRVVSIGGVLSDDPGVAAVEHLYHFYGSRDPIQAVGQKLYAGRWPIFPRSSWNLAMQSGKLTFTCLGPMKHVGAGYYWDPDTTLPDGRSYSQVTLDGVLGAMRREGLLAGPVER